MRKISCYRSWSILFTLNMSALGYCWPGKISIFGSHILSRNWWLHSRIRCWRCQDLWQPWGLEASSPHSVGRPLREFPFIVLGNKVDIDENQRAVWLSYMYRLIQQISREVSRAWCQSNGNMPFFETSAKSAINIEIAFETLARHALKRIDVLFDCLNSDLM